MTATRIHPHRDPDTWYLYHYSVATQTWKEIASSAKQNIGEWLFMNRVAAYPGHTIRLIHGDDIVAQSGPEVTHPG